MNKLGPAKTLAFLWMLIAAAAWTNGVLAQTASGPERQRIEALIARVGGLKKDAKFIRNGKSYDGSSAVQFLRGKWEANDATVKTAQDFIDKIASVSGTSNKPYLIRFNDGREVTSRDFLLAELKKIDLRTQTSP